MGCLLYLTPPIRSKYFGEYRENPYIEPMTQANDPDSRLSSATGLSRVDPSTALPVRNNQSVIVPIRSLGANHRPRIAGHLLSLEPRDRYLRFGYAASDEHILRYVDGLDLVRDEVFGIYNRKLALIAMAHLAYPKEITRQSCAEFGVSVLQSARGRGYGARLFERAAMHARNDGISQMIIHALSENTPMLRIARAAGAVVSRDGPESEAYLRLPEPTLDSRLTEIVHEQLAQADYHMKERAHQFRSLLTSLQPAPVAKNGSGSIPEVGP